MKNAIIRNGIIALALVLITMFTTCSVIRNADKTATASRDTVFLHQWRMEKQRTENLIVMYKASITALKDRYDSLEQMVSFNKKAMAAYRFKARYLEQRLKTTLTKKTDSTGKIPGKEILPVVDSLVTAQVQSDSACDSVIVKLESVIANRDSSMALHEQVENRLRDLDKEQELRTAYLTEQLNTAYKVQRKKTRQNKLLAGGLLILSGITTSLLLTHVLK